MAINPETQYPGKIAPSSPDYPYGAARNITVPGDGTGTPWEAALVNDQFGFQQALMAAAGVTPSGTPDKVGASQYLEAIRKITGKLTDGKKYQFMACAIRNTGGGWAFINDSEHEPIGFTGISTLPDGRIQLDHAFGATEVGSLLVVPDETFAKEGILAGGSIGLDLSLITISAPLEFLVNVDSGAINAPYYWNNQISVVAGTTLTEITHPACVVEGVPSAVKVGISPSYHTDTLLSYGDTLTRIYGAGDVDGYIAYNGASWVYTGDLSNAPTVVWDAPSSTLTVTHDKSDPLNLNIEPRDDGYFARPDSVGDTSFEVKFYDFTGAIQTTQSTNMKFFFSRKSTARKNILEGQFAVQRGYAPVDANELTSGSGNFWIIGVNEVA